MKARQARRKVTASTNNKGWTAPEGYMMPTKSEGKKGRNDGTQALLATGFDLSAIASVWDSCLGAIARC